MEAKQTIERISRGQFRLLIVQHGEGGKNREIQVVDVVHGYMIKGVTEQAVIAHILLDSRTAAKSFESIKAGTELERESRRVEGSRRTTGFRRVVEANKGKFKKPKSLMRPWPKLRPAKSAEQIQREGEEAEAAEAERLASEEAGIEAVVVAEETEAAEEKRARATIEPDELAAAWEFENDDAKGLFIGITTAFGSAAVDEYLQRCDMTGVLDQEFVTEMGEILGTKHEIERAAATAEVVDEKPKKGKKAAKVFVPKKNK